MLLNELQKQDEMIRKLEARLAALEAQLASTTAKVTSAQVSRCCGWAVNVVIRHLHLEPAELLRLE